MDGALIVTLERGTTMLLVDPQGPKGAFLLEPLQQAGLPAVLADPQLTAGDLAFCGRGIGGQSVNIGIEFKRLDSSSTDLAQSLRSGRLSGEQLPKLLGEKGAYDTAWLLVEGVWRTDPKSGLVTAYKGKHRGWQAIPGKMPGSELEKRLLTLELLGGLHVRFTNTRADSIRFIGSLYRWWTDRDMDKHVSHLAVHDAPSFRPVSDVAAALMRWPGVGYKAAAAAEARFKGSVVRAAQASDVEWAALDIGGKKFGRARAEKLVTWLRGGVDERKKR
jgi:ERCC4-type nuclease